MGLDKIGQNDFSAGAFRGVARHLIPANGVYRAENVLLDDDGSLYARGGAAVLSTAAFGTGLRWVADLFLAAGRRTVIASSSAFGVLDAAEAPVSLGGAGVTTPPTVAVLGGVAYIGGGTMYAGSRKSADYSTGTVTVTNGSATVTGVGTSWLANVDAGMLFQVSGRYYVVDDVGSNTSLTLRDAYEEATAAGQAYTLTRLGTAAVVAETYAAAGDRLWAADGTKLRLSAGRSATTGALQAHSFDALDYHEMPLGAEIIGLAPARDVLMVFTTGGLLAVSNVYFDLTDAFGNPQQTLEQVSQDLILWGAPGLTTWQGAVIAPCIDGVWLVSAGDAPVKVSKSIQDRYQDHVQDGDLPGQSAVFRGHLLLPVVDSAAVVGDLLVCRLDRPADDGRGSTVWPWTWLVDHDAEVPALAVRVGGQGESRSPQLLGASRNTDARVLDCSSYFAPAAGNKVESDGSARTWVIETRDFATGSENLNTVRRMQVRYEFEDAAADDPLILGYVSKGTTVTALTTWGSFTWGSSLWSDSELAEWQLLVGQAPEMQGRDPYTWPMAVRTRYVRGRLESSDPAANMVLRSIAFFIRSSRKDR